MEDEIIFLRLRQWADCIQLRGIEVARLAGLPASVTRAQEIPRTRCHAAAGPRCRLQPVGQPRRSWDCSRHPSMADSKRGRAGAVSTRGNRRGRHDATSGTELLRLNSRHFPSQKTCNARCEMRNAGGEMQNARRKTQNAKRPRAGARLRTAHHHVPFRILPFALLIASGRFHPQAPRYSPQLQPFAPAPTASTLDS